jgi:hypothetical protein
MSEKEEIITRHDLETLLRNRAFMALLKDLGERKADHLTDLTQTLLTTPKKVAEANRIMGQLRELDYIYVFPELVLGEIEDRERKEKEEKEDKEGKENGE